MSPSRPARTCIEQNGRGAKSKVTAALKATWLEVWNWNGNGELLELDGEQALANASIGRAARVSVGFMRRVRVGVLLTPTAIPMPHGPAPCGALPKCIPRAGDLSMRLTYLSRP